MPTVIGLMGYATAGKDEAARALFPLGFRRVSNADPVRSGLLALNPIVLLKYEYNHDGHISDVRGVRLSEIVELHGWDNAKKIPEVRELLQRYGTEAGREIHGADCWCRIARRDVADLLSRGYHAVITDIRFQEEIDFVAEFSGVLWRITRPGVGPVNGHRSESLVAICEREIANDSTVQVFHDRVRDAAVSLLRTSP